MLSMVLLAVLHIYANTPYIGSEMTGGLVEINNKTHA